MNVIIYSMAIYDSILCMYICLCAIQAHIQYNMNTQFNC